MEQRAEETSAPGVYVLTATPAPPVERGVVVSVEKADVAPRTLLERWLPLIYMGMITGAEMVFIELYCHWHGAQMLLPNPLKLYSAENVQKLTSIGFVGGSATVMSFTAEILIWASLGVWSERISGMVHRYELHKPDPSHDLTEYIGSLGCHTSIAAAVMIVLKLSGFQVFGISVDNFEATAGTAFILGYFGRYTEQLMNKIRMQVFGASILFKEKPEETDAPQ